MSSQITDSDFLAIGQANIEEAVQNISDWQKVVQIDCFAKSRPIDCLGCETKLLLL